MKSAWLPKYGLFVGDATSAMVVQSVPASSDDAVALLAALLLASCVGIHRASSSACVGFGVVSSQSNPS